MGQPKHYVFHASACAAAARIRRPKPMTMPAHGAAALPITGGESRADHPTCKWPEQPEAGAAHYLTFDSVLSHVNGDFEDAAQATAMTRGEVPVESLAALTGVTSEVRNVSVMGRVTAARVVMKLQARSVTWEPSIRCEGSVLEGVAVDGHPVSITLATDFFSQHDTLAKLGDACGTPTHRHCFFDGGEGARHGFVHRNGTGKATLVKEITWAGPAHPNATIDGHCITIPDFGKVYFGELFVTAASRRLTMMRFQLGSPVGGEICLASGDTNGSQWPPTGP
ncbi:MAG: hypothetical protein JST11_24855 [Acidobacteria bacterium]|nr:hypothetical protein [Acidobacteriota bacterium]